MQIGRVTSADGTTIAFERLGAGDGLPVIVVGGATCDRAMTRPLAEALARHVTVINYDRRGRGDSDDPSPYAIAREVDDLRALIAEAGGRASVYGHSSGAGLVCRRQSPISPSPRSCSMMRPTPLTKSRNAGSTPTGLRTFSRRIVAATQSRCSVRRVGMSLEMIDGMRRSPAWAGLEALAPTLAYDCEVVGDRSGGAVPLDIAKGTPMPALVLVGAASPAFMLDVGRQLTDAMPGANLEVLQGHNHVVPPEILAPIIVRFLAA